MGLKRGDSIDRYLCEAMLQAYCFLMVQAFHRGEISVDHFRDIQDNIRKATPSVKTVGRESPAPVVAQPGSSAEDQGF